jgi:hypothetical protein
LSLISIILIALGVVLFAALLLVAAVLFTPFVFTIDSRSWQMRVRWLGTLEYWRPLPGAMGETGLCVAGRTFPLPARGARRKRKPAGAVRKPRNRRVVFARFMRRCLGQPSIRRALAAKFGELWRRILRSASLTRRRLSVSLPDPAWNGMLAGWLALRHSGRGSAIRINFTGENAVLLEVRLYPYRIAVALLLFLMGLPYRALYREWRASSVIALG